VDEKRIVELAGGINLATVDTGGTGDPVVLLHGFPDTSAVWRHQIPVLADEGFRVIAPDMRGFGDSSKPQAVEDYKVMKLVGDVSALMRALGVERAHVVGHDWGAAVAWLLASLMPRKVDHLVAMSVGHPNVHHSPSLAQREKGWYILFFQFQGVAEELLRRHNWRLFRQTQEGGDVERYVRELAGPGSLTAALNVYRANRSPAAELETLPRLPFIVAPTMGLWSTGDQALLEEGMLQSAGFVNGPWRYERVDGVGHWIQLEAPEQFTKLLTSFLGSETSRVQVRPRRRY
jgi:pimeloyl-ACP methyl ester carboxylesterase